MTLFSWRLIRAGNEPQPSKDSLQLFSLVSAWQPNILLHTCRKWGCRRTMVRCGRENISVPSLADMNIWQHTLNTKPGAVLGTAYAEAGSTGSAWLLGGAQAYPHPCQIRCGCSSSSPGVPLICLGPSGSTAFPVGSTPPHFGLSTCPQPPHGPCRARCMDALFSPLGLAYPWTSRAGTLLTSQAGHTAQILGGDHV